MFLCCLSVHHLRCLWSVCPYFFYYFNYTYLMIGNASVLFKGKSQLKRGLKTLFGVKK